MIIVKTCRHGEDAYVMGARTKKAVLHIIERCHSAPRASQAEEAADF